MRSLKRQRGFIGIGTAIGLGSVLGPAIGGYFGNQAANTQASSANRGQDIQAAQFQQTQQNLAPWMQSGNMALNQINQGTQPGGQFNHMFGLQDFQQSPAYQFNLQQGQMAVDKAANAKGGGNLYAPQTMQDLSRFSQGLASNEFQNAFSNYQTGIGNIYNRLSNLSSGGQNAAASLGGFGTTTAGNIANMGVQAGNASASGQMAIGNAAGGAINNLTNLAMMNQFLRQNQASSVNPMDLSGVMPG